jgi:oligopeptide transport system substrate-binding protein
MKFWKVKFHGAIILLFLLLTSCQKNQVNSGSMLRLNFQEGDLPSLHPHLIEGHLRGHVLASMIYEGLTELNEEGKAELRGAQRITISQDQKHYTIELRKLRWSDGSPLTAHHYEKAWKQALEPTADCPEANLFYVIKNAKEAKQSEISLDHVGIKAVNDSTLQVELAYPAPFFLQLLAQPIFSPVTREMTEPTRFNGPFIVEKWSHNQFLSLKPNPFFWDSQGISLSKIEIYFVTDASTAQAMYERKEIDFLGEPITRLSNEAVLYYQKRGELQQKFPDRFFWIFFNTAISPFHNVSFRQAFSYALDRQKITEHILLGDLPLNTPFPKHISRSGNSVQTDLEKAKSLFEVGLTQLGYTRQSLPAISLSYFNDVPGFKELAEYCKETWEKVFQIPIAMEGMEWNVFFSYIQTGQFQMGGFSQSALYLVSIEFLQRFVSKNHENLSKWTSPAFQAKINQIQLTTNQQYREHMLQEAEEMLLDEMPMIPVCAHTHFYICDGKWKGLRFDPSGAVNFSRVYIEKADANE